MDEEEMLAFIHRTIETASRVRKLISRERESGVHVSIHVSTDVFTWLLRRARQAVQKYGGATPDPDRPIFFGFPVVHEESWTGTRIEVHTRRVIV